MLQVSLATYPRAPRHSAGRYTRPVGIKKEEFMSEDGRKTSLPEKKRLVAEAIRKLTDATMSGKASHDTPEGNSTSRRHKSTQPAAERFTGRDA